jgi:CRP-like cAMP-binding protein
MVDEKLILETKAEAKKFTKGDLILCEGDHSQYFYYLMEGELSIFNSTEEGKDFLQHKVVNGHFFAEPAVLLGKPLPGSVEVSSDKAKVLKIRQDIFLDYLKKNPEKMLEFTKSIAEKAWGKSQSLRNIVFLSPIKRVFNLLEDYKKERDYSGEKILIKLTRRELSNMAGLRIETIIRTVKKMEKEGQLEIRNGKVYF